MKRAAPGAPKSTGLASRSCGPAPILANRVLRWEVGAASGVPGGQPRGVDPALHAHPGWRDVRAQVPWSGQRAGCGRPVVHAAMAGPRASEVASAPAAAVARLA